MDIYCSLKVTNCCGERSFSKLKRTKNELRSTGGKIRLNNLRNIKYELNEIEKLFSESICLKKMQKARSLSSRAIFYYLKT